MFIRKKRPRLRSASCLLLKSILSVYPKRSSGGSRMRQNVKLLKLYLAIENTLYLCIKDKINNEKSYRLYSCFY